MKTSTFAVRLVVATVAAIVVAVQVAAAASYGPGVTDTEIKLGQTMPYSGNNSAYGTVGKAEAAYFDMINASAGINGRRIRLISLDDGFSPPKTVEQTRKLVEQEEVLAIFSSLGSPTNSAIHKYVNAKGVPHLFLPTGATKWGDPKNFPWTMGWFPSYQTEARIYAKYMLKNKPDARIAVLYQNDDYGKDLLKGLQDGLGDKVTMIVAKASYEITDPTADSQIVQLQASRADAFVIFATPKFAAQAIRKSHDMNWTALRFLSSVVTSVSAVMRPAGPEKGVGIISATYLKDPADPSWGDDAAMKDYLSWLKKWYPAGDAGDLYNVWGYSIAQTMVQVLKRCGDDLTRDNVMRQAANLKDFDLPMLLPGIQINTGPSDFYPIEQMQLMRFDGKTWVRFGEVLGK
jgi:branched-chain amino acid transport system substrate-binding protein